MRTSEVFYDLILVYLVHPRGLAQKKIDQVGMSQSSLGARAPSPAMSAKRERLNRQIFKN